MKKKQIVLSMIIVTFLFMLDFRAAVPALATDATQSSPTQLCTQGTFSYLQGQRTNAMQQLESGFDSLQQTANADQTVRGQCSFYLGQLRQSIGDWDGALAAYTVALDDFRATNNQQLEWGALFGIGSIYMSQGRMTEGTHTLSEALNLLHTSPQSWFPAGIKQLAEASTLNNLTNIKSRQASLLSADDSKTQTLFDEAESDYKTVLQILGTLSAQTSGSELLDEQSTLLLLQQLGELISGGETNSGEVDLFSDFTESLLGEIDAPVIFGDLSALFSSLGGINELVPTLSHDLQALVWNNLGETYRMQEKYADALDSYEQSLLIAVESLDQQEGLLAPTSRQFGILNQAFAWNNIGLVLYDQGDILGALACFEQAETAARQVSNSLFLVRVLISKGTLHQEQGQSVEALMAFEEALDLLELLRLATDNQLSQVSSNDSSQTADFALTGSLVQLADLYQYVAGIYFQVGENEKAFYTAERGRARLFLNMLTAGQLRLLDDAGADLLAQEREAFILQMVARDDLARADNLGIDPLTRNMILAEVETAEAEYEAILTAVENRDDRLAALVSDKSNVLQLTDVQALLDEQTTLIAYYQLIEQSRSGLDVGGVLAFIITKNDFTTVALPEATNDNVTTAVNNLHKWLNRSNAHPKPLRDLHSWLIAPLDKYIDTPSVGIIPHQTLHYVPFAALTDGETYFGEAHSLFVIPSATVLPLIQENVASANKTDNSALVFGNPETTNLRSLPGSAAEAQAVAALLEASVYIGAEATESRFWSDAPEARVIHLAAHGIYDEALPLESTIHLTAAAQQDGRLQVAELYHLDLKAADMVVLSSCQTNVGLISAGDEVVGLTRAFFNAGTPSIIASLWLVDDEATAALMVAFYRYWLEDGLSKAEALQAAQADVRTLEDGRYASPFYWAGFVLNGDGGVYTGLVLEPPPTPVTAPLPEPEVTNAPILSTQTPNPTVIEPEENDRSSILYGVVFIVLLSLIGLWVSKRIRGR